MSPDSPPLTLTIPSDLACLGVARAFVEAVCQALEVDQPTTNAIVLATNEATSNVMRHAHRDRPQATIQLQCRCRSDGLEVRLFDEGAPFDVGSVPDLDPAELRVGGRGVYLMRALMDELRCEPRGEGGNVLCMVKICRCRFEDDGRG